MSSVISPGLLGAPPLGRLEVVLRVRTWLRRAHLDALLAGRADPNCDPRLRVRATSLLPSEPGLSSRTRSKPRFLKRSPWHGRCQSERRCAGPPFASAPTTWAPPSSFCASEEPWILAVPRSRSSSSPMAPVRSITTACRCATSSDSPGWRSTHRNLECGRGSLSDLLGRAGAALPRRRGHLRLRRDQLAGREADAAVPGVPVHLHDFPACHEHHDSLLALLAPRPPACCRPAMGDSLHIVCVQMALRGSASEPIDRRSCLIPKPSSAAPRHDPLSLVISCSTAMHARSSWLQARSSSSAASWLR
jgi:hypothetical protein